MKNFLKHGWPPLLVVAVVGLVSGIAFTKFPTLYESDIEKATKPLEVKIDRLERGLHNVNMALLKLSSNNGEILIPKGTKIVRDLKTNKDRIVELPEHWIAQLQAGVNETE